MTASTREKQQDYRARMALLGMREVRGIYLPPDLHAHIKALARAMVEKLERARNKEPQQ